MQLYYWEKRSNAKSPLKGDLNQWRKPKGLLDNIKSLILKQKNLKLNPHYLEKLKFGITLIKKHSINQKISKETNFQIKPKPHFHQNWKKFKRITSQCHPPSPTAFFTTPWRPTSTDLVRLFPVTTTLVWRGSTESSSSLLSPQLCNCEKPPPLTELSIASNIVSPTTKKNSQHSESIRWVKLGWNSKLQWSKLHWIGRSCIGEYVYGIFVSKRERN